MPRISWIEDENASGDLAEVYSHWKKEQPDRDCIPDILKCFSMRPDFLKSVIGFSCSLHFSDGHLDRRTKEMIATFVSGLNQCPY